MKKLAVILATLCVTGCLAGCSGDNGDGDQGFAEETSAEVVENVPAEPAEPVESVEVKYTVDLDITCEENLFFSRYDVAVLVDGQHVGVMEHGATDHFEVEVTEGEHELAFQKEDDPVVDGVVRFEVTQKMVVSCSLALTSDQIEVKDLEVLTDEEYEARQLAAQEEAQLQAQESEDTYVPAESETPDQTADLSPEDNVITADNSAEFASFLETDNFDTIASFVSAHQGDVIEFNGNIANVQNHGDFTTRFDFLVYAGDFSATSGAGPSFQFRDASFYDLHLTDESVDAVTAGMNLTIKAKLLEYNSASSLVLLDPVQISVR